MYSEKDKTNYNCPKCSSKLYKEIVKEIDYPFVCLECDENFYGIEVENGLFNKLIKKWRINKC